MAKKRARPIYEPPQKFHFEHGGSHFRVTVDATIRNDSDGKKWEQIELFVAETIRVSRLLDRLNSFLEAPSP